MLIMGFKKCPVGAVGIKRQKVEAAYIGRIEGGTLVT
jgi:hypothetical protein